MAGEAAAAQTDLPPLILAAPMKFNLALHILGKRADGYHELESLVAFSAQGDELRFARAECDSFSIDGAYAARLGRSRHNLVLQARNALRALFGPEHIPPVSIHLTKNLPVAAGLGGGSADAAAALFGLTAFNKLNPYAFGGGSEREDEKTAPPALMRLAAALGADVPMCLAWFYQKTAFLARGKGEALQSLPQFPSLPIVVVNNGLPLSTRRVFAALEPAVRPALPPVPLPGGAGDCDFSQWIEWLQNLRNDLYEPALRIQPELGEVLQLLRASGAAYCAMSGSGASCFGLYSDKAAAAAGAAFIRVRAAQYFVAAAETDGAAPA